MAATNAAHSPPRRAAGREHRFPHLRPTGCAEKSAHREAHAGPESERDDPAPPIARRARPAARNAIEVWGWPCTPPRGTSLAVGARCSKGAARGRPPPDGASAQRRSA
eukprot:5107830-Prymnesium_polylepis.1